MKFELGLFENPRRPNQERIETAIGSAAHARLNMEAARRSLVLLRNEEGLLPLAGGYTADRSAARPKATGLRAASRSSARSPTMPRPSWATGPEAPVRPAGSTANPAT
ncbi:glycoside hydrolase family 3 protein [Tessaracoccus sp.]|uniref:hypothetical protein n=1 Tax=Tessaracoccus sp. TaxID=1971211 RepID=UPI00260BD7C3|nr:hypothetical protein [Tessaracoccus sp.]